MTTLLRALLASGLAHWRDLLIGAAVVGLVTLCHARDTSIAAKARAEVLYHQADSAVKANAPRLARTDTLIVHDTVRIRRTLAQLDTLRDTLLAHVTDTVLVKEFVTRTDSAAQACSDLAHDCAAFRFYATQRFASDSIKLSTQPAAVIRSCTAPEVTVGVLAAATGYALHALVRRP